MIANYIHTHTCAYIYIYTCVLYNIVIVDSVGIPIDQPLDATGAGVHSHCTWGSFGPGRSFWPGGMAGCCGSWQLSRCGKSTATIWLSINFTCLLKWLSGIRWGDIWSMDNYYDYFTTFFFHLFFLEISMVKSPPRLVLSGPAGGWPRHESGDEKRLAEWSLHVWSSIQISHKDMVLNG